MVGDILQPSHLLFILVIALLVLGPKRLPEVGRSLGRGLRDFKTSLSGADPREDLAELHQHTAAPVQMSEPVATPAQEPVAASAPAAQAPAPTAEQYESD